MQLAMKRFAPAIERKRSREGGHRAFTLVELLVVVALVGTLLAAGVAGLRRRGGLAREAAVALLAARVAEARTLAVTRGAAVRMLVHADPGDPERFLRFVVLAVRDGETWRLVDDGTVLPEGTALLPPDGPGEAGPGIVRRNGDDWGRPSGGVLRSTALVSAWGRDEVPEFPGCSRWLHVHFSATGGTFGGDLVVACATRRDGALPVTLVCEQPDAVVGLALSSYGVPAFTVGRSEF